MATTQRRFQAIFRNSSGEYFLPGSIVSPRSAEHRGPDAYVGADALTADVPGDSSRQHGAVVESILIDRVVPAQIDVAGKRVGHAAVSLIRVEPVCGSSLRTDADRAHRRARADLDPDAPRHEAAD